MTLRSSFPLVALLLPATAWPQAPAGPQFQVNVYTTSFQSDPRVAADRAGNFLIVWPSLGQDGDRWGVFGRRFDAGGVPIGGEFQVNTYTTGHQGPLGDLSVAVSPHGRSLVAWATVTATEADVHGQRYDARGAPSGTEFEVSLASYKDAHVGVGAGGHSVVLWQSSNQIQGHRYDPSGAPVGADFQVSAHTAPFFPPSGAQVQVAPDGSFVVAWTDLDGPLPPPPVPPSPNYGVFARVYDAAGAPATPPLLVNTNTLDWQMSPALIRQPAGQFVVAWRDYSRGVFGRFFSAAGAPLGQEFQVSTGPAAYADLPSMASDGAGNFVVAWAAGGEIVARRFDSAGAPRSGEFIVNVPSAQSEGKPSVGSDQAGNFVVAWQNTLNTTENIDVVARRFGGLSPAALAIAGGSGVLEIGSFGLATTWRNDSDAPQAVEGRAVWCTGAPNLLCTIGANQATYGTIAPGAMATCSTACITGSLAGTRPAGHVDVRLEEDILPATQGQAQVWSLHLGGSFADVPPANPFYRFVETLLHHGVSAGCGGGSYCPASSTTRDQMAVFVLVAREGTDWAPPACATPVFADVPAGSGFCRWIEELARRGVVAGCGSGNYCPGAPVTREQMAVFVLRTLDPSLSPPACTTPLFADVPAGSPFCRWIEELARRGIVTGCGGGNYCPAQAVTREQMGVFIAVTFGLTLYGP